MPLEHSDNCPFLLRQGTHALFLAPRLTREDNLTHQNYGAEECTCYMSTNKEDLGSRQSAFTVATSHEDFSENDPEMEEVKSEQIRQFVASRATYTGEKNAQTSSDPAYATLRPGEIRVLQLYPGAFEDELHGALVVVSIDFKYKRFKGIKPRTNHALSLPRGDRVWYTALSYTWGAPDFNTRFHLGGGEFINITSSLASALKHLRNATDSGFLWIDQICINQKSVAEKETQIPLMGMIYRNAVNTVVWLGDEEDQEPQVAFDTLQLVHGRLSLSDEEVSPNDFARLGFPSPDAREWKRVSELFGRFWFTRTWVIQEAILSWNLYIKCGAAVVGWDDFALWCQAMESSGLRPWVERLSPTQQAQSGLHTAFELSTFRVYYQVNVEPPLLLEGLVLTRYANASVAKDKVYGVLGVAGESGIRPRYSDEVSARDVFLEAAIARFPADIFATLLCVDHDQPLSPSWVPDWTQPRVAESLGYSTKSWAIYQASEPYIGRALIAGNQTVFGLEDDNRSLSLRGRIVDTIAFLSEIHDEDPFSLIKTQDKNSSVLNETLVQEIETPITQEGKKARTKGKKAQAETKSPRVQGRSYLAKGSKSFIECIRMIKENTTYVGKDTVWDAFWQTLVAGRVGFTIPLTPQDYSEILSLLVDKCYGSDLHIAGQPYSPRRQKDHKYPFDLESLASRKPKLITDDLKKAMKAAMHKRKFAITKRGYFCLVPRGSRLGDDVVVFKGGHMPFIIRDIEQSRAKETKVYALLGEAYVHGIMHGEAFSDSEDLEWIKLV